MSVWPNFEISKSHSVFEIFTQCFAFELHFNRGPTSKQHLRVLHHSFKDLSQRLGLRGLKCLFSSDINTGTKISLPVLSLPVPVSSRELHYGFRGPAFSLLEYVLVYMGPALLFPDLHFHFRDLDYHLIKDLPYCFGSCIF